jgi:uncharacterized membrane protein YkoI
MNFKSYGPRLVFFLVAAAVGLGGFAWTELDADGGADDIAAAAAEAAPLDNDDNPRVNRFDGADADDRPLTASERAKVTAAASQAVGSGTVTDMEASDDFGTAYEAEVYDHGGAEWDVELDARFAVVSKSRDS